MKMTLVKKIIILLLCVQFLIVACYGICLFTVWYSTKENVNIVLGTYDLLPYERTTFKIDTTIKKGAMVEFFLENITFEPHFTNDEYCFKILLLQSDVREERIIYEQDYSLSYDAYFKRFTFSFQATQEMNLTSIGLVNLTNVKLLKSEVSFFSGKIL